MEKNILVINSGSTSLKYKFFVEGLKLVKSGYIEYIGEEEVADHDQALKMAIEELGDFKDKIDLIGHRVVHGGEEFVEPTIVDGDVLKKLEKYNELAPLHNPANLMGIKAATKLFPGIKNIAVFDTAFHQTLPEKAWRYAINDEYYKKYKIRRFGFHGISHEYVYEKVKSEKKKAERVISCHLGGGCSVCAIKDGKSVDISMGFTPLEGLVMMSRCGDIDPEIPLYLQKKEGLSPEKMSEILNFKSGILSLCGEKDWLKVLEGVRAEDVKMKLAFDIFIYCLQKYIGAYYAALGGLDVLVFTGSIGAGDSLTRDEVCKGLAFLDGVEVEAIKTDEEKMIAEKILNI